MPVERRESGQHNLLRARLNQIADLARSLCELAHTCTIGWRFLEARFGTAHTDKPDCRRCRPG